MKTDQHKKNVIDIWSFAVKNVIGENAVRQALDELPVTEIDNILAVGKAAGSMLSGCTHLQTEQTKILLVTKYGHAENIELNRNFTVIESGHPAPDQISLNAGKSALEFVRSIPTDKELVMLVSGGASALLEHLKSGLSLDDLKTINRILISEGFDIGQINRIRTSVSTIKGGQLLANFRGKMVRVFAISDVPSDDIRVIGSGIGARDQSSGLIPPVPSTVEHILGKIRERGKSRPELPAHRYQAQIVACNDLAREDAQSRAKKLGYAVNANRNTLSRDIGDAATEIINTLRKGEAGSYIWGGEPTIELPENPGQGGRNQHLGLLVAQGISDLKNIVVLVAGTDGTDGPTEAAGGIVDVRTFEKFPGGEQALRKADAGTYLKKCGALINTGPTGTNVMDLVIGIKY